MHKDAKNNGEQRFVTTSFAHVIINDEIGVILDLRRDEFLGLSKIARQIWMLIATGKTPLETTRMLEIQYEAEPTLLLTDVLQFIHTMEERGLLKRYDEERHAQHVPSKIVALELQPPYDIAVLPLAIINTREWQQPELQEAFATLQSVDELMKRVGLNTFASALMDLPVHRSITAEDAEMRQLANVVMEAADWLPFKTACLHQYLALAWILRRRHVRVDVVIGIYTYPFSAHVWLESDGYMVQWRAGMGYTADIRRIEAMSVIFHTGKQASLTKEVYT